MSNTQFLRKKMRYGTIVILCLMMVMVLRYGLIGYSLDGRLFPSYNSYNSSNHLNWDGDWVLPEVRSSANGSQVFPSYTLISSLFKQGIFSSEEIQPLLTWDSMNVTISAMDSLPHFREAVMEGREAWQRLMDSVEGGRGHGSLNGSSVREVIGKQCPYSIREMNTSKFGQEEFKLSIPCGLVQGSSITLIGTPGGLLGEFRIDLTGARFPGEQDPPIILHYNVRLHGDKITEDPVIVQNSWTVGEDWGTEERCPSPDARNSKKVDGLDQCSEMVSKVSNHGTTNKINGSGSGSYFPFRQGYLAIATLRVGMEGIQMTVDGKHVTSFAYRDRLEPWFANEVKISGDIKLISIVVNGLPMAENSDNVIDLDALKSPHLPLHKPLALFIGIFSTANNFKRRMAIRRTWLQYPAVKSGAVAARFFVGLHKNQMVNEELWHEAQTYGDIQLMPFVDYYSLITWKTIAICVYSINIVSAKYVMKTDDDSFIRIDDVLSSLKGKNVAHGLLYGLITYNDQPQRTTDSKWYISPEEWPSDTYPPWAHGPGYIVSHDIAKIISEMHKTGSLWMFKLEDVAMGIWIAQMKRNGMEIKYENEGRIYMEGCETGYMIAHYQSPRDMLCLWQRLKETNEPTCCGE